jgi:hypothetical protein
MRFFGYRNLGIVFIPFLGAIARGTPEKRDPRHSAIVSLSGPGLGLLSAILALELHGAIQNDWFLSYARMSFFINFLNLLPIRPLDGGQFMNEILFSRHPYLEVVFGIVSAFAMCIGATIQFGQPGLAGGFAVGISRAVVNQLKLTQVSQAVRKGLGDVPVEKLTAPQVALIQDQIRRLWLAQATQISRMKNPILGYAATIRSVWMQLERKPMSFSDSGLLFLAALLTVGVPLGFMRHQGAPLLVAKAPPSSYRLEAKDRLTFPKSSFGAYGREPASR